MITSEEFYTLKEHRIKNFVNSAFSEFKDILYKSNPDSDGYYEISLPSIGWFTDKEKEIIQQEIEKGFINGEWEFVRLSKRIYGYRIRPSQKSVTR